MKVEQWRGLTIQDHLQSLRGLGIGCSTEKGKLGRETGKPPLHYWSTDGRGPQRSSGAGQTRPTRCEQVMMAWETADSQTQSQIFRTQLRYAKCPKALIHEMTMFWNEKYGETAEGLPSEYVVEPTPQVVCTTKSLHKNMDPLPVPRRESQSCATGSSISLVDLTQTLELPESRRISTLESAHIEGTPRIRTQDLNSGCTNKLLTESPSSNSQSMDMQTTTKAYREALANLRKDKKDIFAIPAYKQPQCPKQPRNRDEIAREVSVEELPRSPAWFESNCGFPNPPSTLR